MQSTHMKAHYVFRKKDKEEEPIVSRQLKICIACGNTEVQEYEFGISCEICGTSFYFGRVFTEVN